MTADRPMLPAWERRLIRPTPRLTPSQWAEQFRILPRGRTSRPGPWRNSNAPYLRAIMDVASLRGVNEVVVMKCAQAGVSEAFRNLIGWAIQTDPDPMLFVMPDEKSGRKIMRQRILPMLRDTPSLAALLPDSGHAVQVRTMTLDNGFTFTLGWSGSPTSLASDPVRRVILDEVDKYVDWSGNDGSPIDLARIRTQTYEHRRFIAQVSTPTTTSGYIAQAYDAADVRLVYAVPCPHCGTYQRLVWAHVKWKLPEGATPLAAAIALRKPGAVWYECAACRERIDESEKADAVNRGVWASEADIDADGFAARAAATPANGIASDLADAKAIAFHVSALYCLWVRWADIAAEFLRSKDNPASLFAFQTSWLGEPWTERIVRPAVGDVDDKASGARLPPLIVPAWCSRLIATVDVQKDRFYYVVRAWGERQRSQRVAHGLAYDWQELERLALDAQYQIESGGASISPHILLIDAGYRVPEVCRFASKHLSRVRLCKGAARPMSPPVKLYPPHERQTEPHWALMFWGDDFKDILAGLIRSEDTDEFGGDSQWELNQQHDADYSKQLASEHKIIVRSGGRAIERWIPVSPGAPNHYWDCEVMQCVGANVTKPEISAPVAARMAQVAAALHNRGSAPKPNLRQFRGHY